MLESFKVAVNAVIPFLIYMVYGYLARSAGAVKEPFLRELNNIIFRLMFPFVTFYNIYGADIDAFPSLKLIIFAPASILVLIAILMIIVPLLVKENRRRGVIIQAIVRSNFVLFALPLVLSIYGDRAGSVTAMIVTIVVTVYNIAFVVILEYFRSADLSESPVPGSGKKLARDIAFNVIKNPLLQGACLGILFQLFGIKLPSGIDKAVKTLSDIPTPVALFILGGTLNFGSIRRNLGYLVPSLTFKLVIIPAVMVSIAYMLGLRTLELFLVLAMYATPIAVASFPMAQSMGGDGELAGHFVVLSTVASVVTLFFWIFFLDFAGLLF